MFNYTILKEASKWSNFFPANIQSLRIISIEKNKDAWLWFGPHRALIITLSLFVITLGDIIEFSSVG